MEIKILQELCGIHSPSGEEENIRDYLLDFIQENMSRWTVKPQIFSGKGWQNNIVLVFGKPRTAIFAHMDTIGFTSRYEDQLIPIGSPEMESGYFLTGMDSLGPINCQLIVTEDHKLKHDFGRPIQRGTSLTWKPNFRKKGKLLTSGHMDNRLGIYNALQVAKTLTDGIIVFSTWEEHGGGSVPYLIRHCVENYQIDKVLISDITWQTEGVLLGEGVVISLRDHNIPRKTFTDKIVAIASREGIPFQLEVEGGGSSDGREIQQSPYPIDWCFIGAPEDHVHSPNETVHEDDIHAMIELYRVLMKEL